jgi:preprotein translocase subunit SecY
VAKKQNLFLQFIKLPEMRRKLYIVLFLVGIVQLINVIPVPGVDRDALKQFLTDSPATALLNVYTGGGLTNFSIALLGVGPYITASIVFQLLTHVIPQLETLSKDGEVGRRKIAQYTRLASVPFGIIQGLGMLTYLKNAGVYTDWGVWPITFTLITVIATSVLLMWIGELITEYGIGNGLSLLVTIGVVSTFPQSISNTLAVYETGVTTDQLIKLGVFAVVAAILFMGIIWVTEAVREIPITYARRLRSGAAQEMGGGNVTSVLPLKLNAGGVIPIIFAVSMLQFPLVVAEFMRQSANERTRIFGGEIADFLNNNWIYAALYALLVIAFTFFYATIIFQPKDLAENLQKQSGFIPGIRPGTDTEKYLGGVVMRLTVLGAIFLAVIAVLPVIIPSITDVQTLRLGGTSLLIAVSVVLEIIRQARSQVIMRSYNQYLA